MKKNDRVEASIEWLVLVATLNTIGLFILISLPLFFKNISFGTTLSLSLIPVALSSWPYFKSQKNFAESNF